MGEEPGIVEEILEAQVRCSQEGAGELLVRGDSGSGAVCLPVYLLLSSLCGNKVKLKPFIFYTSVLSWSYAHSSSLFF